MNDEKLEDFGLNQLIRKKFRVCKFIVPLTLVASLSLKLVAAVSICNNV
jgi:hypothetical protein